MARKGRKSKDYNLSFVTKKKKVYQVTFRSKADCTTALRLLKWFSGVVIDKDKVESSEMKILDREKQVKEDELNNLATSLAE